MIFVTVGTHHQGFERLVRAADELAEQSGEQVVIQRGVTQVTPRHAHYFDFCSMQEMQDWITQARVVVAQAGAGTIITAFQQNKPLVVTPRFKAFGENYTDHQIELAAELHRQGRAVLVTELTAESLLEAAQRAMSIHDQPDQSTELRQALHKKMEAWTPGAEKIAARMEKIKHSLNKHQLLLPLVPFLAAAAGLRYLYKLLVWGRTRDEYGISTAYFPNKRVVAFDDRGNTDRFQDEVYRRAQQLLREKDLCRVLDVGCGSGFKLMKYFSDQETLGLELPHTLDFLKQKYPHRQWALSDFANPPEGAFGLTICADVIEHLQYPDALLDFFMQVDSQYFLISTPERGRLGWTARFRPRSRWHVREWKQEELLDYLSRRFVLIEAGILGHHDQYVIIRKV